jgi:hypothetical protein
VAKVTRPKQEELMQRQDGNPGFGTNKQRLVGRPKPSRLLSLLLPTLLQARVVSGELEFVWKVLYASRRRQEFWSIESIESVCRAETGDFTMSVFTSLTIVLCKSPDNKPRRDMWKKQRYMKYIILRRL